MNVIFIRVTTRRGQPSLDLRTTTTDPVLIKKIIEAAIKPEPIEFVPAVTKPLAFFPTLAEKGIVEKTDKGYRWLI